jgi:hypothetical protein
MILGLHVLESEKWGEAAAVGRQMGLSLSIVRQSFGMSSEFGGAT